MKLNVAFFFLDSVNIVSYSEAYSYFLLKS